jgi:hypothetical protein
MRRWVRRPLRHFQPGKGAAGGNRLLAADSDAAYAVGQRRDPIRCEDGYQDLPTVGRHSVVL